MKTVRYQKLVRDKIPQIIRKSGKEPVFAAVSREEVLDYLAKKLQEEAAEYAASREAEELADVLEVIRAIAAESGVAMEEIEKIRARKAQERGGFADRLVLEQVNIPE